MKQSREHPTTEYRILRRTLSTCLSVYLLDGILLGQGGITFLVLCVALLFVVFDFILDRRDYRTATYLTAAYVTTMLAVVATIRVNNGIAERTVLQIADECSAYKSKYGIYPKRLNLLIPEFVDRIPQPKFGIGPFVEIDYSTDVGASAHIGYTQVPPFGRKYYELPNRTWRYLD